MNQEKESKIPRWNAVRGKEYVDQIKENNQRRVTSGDTVDMVISPYKEPIGGKKRKRKTVRKSKKSKSMRKHRKTNKKHAKRRKSRKFRKSRKSRK